MKSIKPKESAFIYNPKGHELTLIADLRFNYDLNCRRFLLDENPYGEPSLVEISDVKINEESTVLSFHAFYRKKEVDFRLESTNSRDNIIFQTIANFDLSFNGKEDLDKVQLFFKDGKFNELETLKQSSDYELISSLTIFNDNDEIVLIKQNPWGRFKVGAMELTDKQQIIYKLEDGSSGIYQVDINPEVYSIFSKLI